MTKILTLFVCFFVIIQLKADHIIGCDASYKSLGNDTFLITTRIYKDCNSSTKVILYTNSFIEYNIISQNCSSFTLHDYSDSTLTVSRDITSVCNSVQSRCQSSSSSYQFGITEYTYINKVYLGNADPGCCQFRIVTGSYGNRLPTSNTLSNITNIYINIYLNRCLNVANSSPVYNETPKFIYYSNTVTNFNNIAIDADSDSLVTVFSIPDANNFTCQYNSPYSPTNPFNSTIGHSLNPNTGEYIFKPGLVQSGVVAYRTQEFRKINGVVTKLGEIYREHVVYILSSNGGNAAPQISSTSNNYTFCPGQQTCFDINTTDANSADSVFLILNQNVSGATFNLSTDKQQNGTMCWTPSASNVRSKPYYFTVSAKDNHCPTTSTNTKTYSFLVAPTAPTDTRNYTNLGCGKVEFKSNIDSTVLHYNPQVIWTVPYNGTTIYTSPILIHNFLQSGTYIIKHSIAYNSNCTNTYFDTITVNSNPVIATPIKDSTVCQQTWISIVPNITIGKSPFIYKYNGVTVNGTFNYLATNDTTFILEITDSNSCIFRDTFTIFIKPITAVNAGSDFSICKNAASINLSGVPAGGTWSGTGLTGNIFNPALYSPGTYPFVYSLNNTNGCMSYDTVMATVIAVPNAYAGRDTILCVLGSNYSLNGTPSGGIWSILTYPTLLNATQFITANAGSGVYTLIYSVTQNGCTNRDTLLITVTTKPIVEAGNDTTVCIGSNSINLTGIPSGGNWNGLGVSNNIFNPQSLTTGIYTLYYSYAKPRSTCNALDSLKITIKPLPTVNAGNDTTICKSSNTFALQGTPTGGTWSGNGVSGNSVLLTQLTSGIYKYAYAFTQNNCTSIDSIKLTITGDPQAAFTANPKTGSNPLTVIFTNQSINATSYSWNFGDPSSGVNNTSTQTNPTHIYNTKGNYSVMLQARSIDGCTKDTAYSNYITVDGVGIKVNTTNKNSFIIYPNPARNIITITRYNNSILDNHSFSIFNVLGQEVINGELQESETTVNMINLSTGIYFVKVMGEIHKLVIE